MMAGRRRSDEIADGFFEALRSVAASHGLRRVAPKLKEMTSWKTQYRNMLALLEGEGEAERVHWLLHYKVSSEPNPDFWWGLTGKILDMMGAAASRRGARWAVVLLAGGPHRGYLLEAQHVLRARSRWSYRPQDDQYKIRAKYLDPSNSLHFSTIADLEDILQLGSAIANE